MSAVHMGSWPVRLVRRIPVCAFRFASPDWPACGEQESAYVSVARPERTILAVTTVPQHDERFGRDRRLRSSRDFAHVRRSGRSVSGTLLAVGFARRATRAWSGTAQPATSARVGFTVGKRVGGAVTRNRVRRRLREAARRRLSGIAPEWDLVVIARPAAADATSEALAQELDTLLSRAKVLKIGGQEPTI